MQSIVSENLNIDTESHSTLFSNNNEIPFNKEYFDELVDCTEFLKSPEKLREFYLKNNYIYLKKYLDSTMINDLRNNYLSLFTAENRSIQHGVKGHPAYDFVRTKEFKSFSESEKLIQAASLILDSKIRLINRKILRHFTKDKIISSRAHIDYSYLDKGSKNVLTAWIPVGDCSLQSGGLVYLKNSQNLDFEELKKQYPEFSDKFWITDCLRGLSKLTNSKWLYSNFEAGDVVFHSSSIVHASLDCRSEYMRISTDLRFSPVNEEIDSRWNGEWSADDGY